MLCGYNVGILSLVLTLMKSGIGLSRFAGTISEESHTLEISKLSYPNKFTFREKEHTLGWLDKLGFFLFGPM